MDDRLCMGLAKKFVWVFPHAGIENLNTLFGQPSKGFASSLSSQIATFPFTFHFHVLEKEMATHSSVLAWRNPGTGEPGGLPSMGLHRVGHD